jgi:hypothetical protein
LVLIAKLVKSGLRINYCGLVEIVHDDTAVTYLRLLWLALKEACD